MPGFLAIKPQKGPYGKSPPRVGFILENRAEVVL
jgi:hypothetical protein